MLTHPGDQGGLIHPPSTRVPPNRVDREGWCGKRRAESEEKWQRPVG